MRNRTSLHWITFIIALLVLSALACLSGQVGVTLTVAPTENQPSPAPQQLPPASPTVETPPTPAQDPPLPTAPANTLLELIDLTDIPLRDPYDLAARFLGLPNVPSSLPSPPNYAVGDVIPFWVTNSATNTTTEVMAELIYAGPHVCIWVEQGVDYRYEGLLLSAQNFEQKIYPTNHAYFGSEVSPGIDGDPRLHILHTTATRQGVAGYFSGTHSFPVSIAPYSNEKEMFFINLGSSAQPGTVYYESVLTHEFQHMIHWNIDRNETSWLNEGLSEVAAFLSGYGPSEFIRPFMQNPDLQLNTWPEGPGGRGPNYGAGYLFATYFLDRFGQDALQALVQNPANGLASVDSTLASIGAGIDGDDLFADWVIANLLNDPNLPPGIYAYPSLPTLQPPQIAESYHAYDVLGGVRQVNQYGADYIRLEGPAKVRIVFQGAQQVPLIPTSTHNTDGDPATDDRFVWWSNRADDSDMTLTRSLDLQGASTATLEFDLWYWLEEHWDYGFVAVSTDDGRTWTPLGSTHTTTYDPHGHAYGPSYSGLSSNLPDANAEGWLHEVVDLTPYAGQVILLRFEVLTDTAVNQPGLAIDNICVAEISFCDNVEGGQNGWEAGGFVRHDNVLPQRYRVQVVLPAGDGTASILQMPLDDQNRGRLSIVINEYHPATLVISGMTRYTTEPAPYTYWVVPVEE